MTAVAVAAAMPRAVVTEATAAEAATAVRQAAAAR